MMFLQNIIEIDCIHQSWLGGVGAEGAWLQPIKSPFILTWKTQSKKQCLNIPRRSIFQVG